MNLVELSLGSGLGANQGLPSRRATVTWPPEGSSVNLRERVLVAKSLSLRGKVLVAKVLPTLFSSNS